MEIEDFYAYLAEHKPEELVKIIEARNKQVAELMVEHKKWLKQKKQKKKQS